MRHLLAACMLVGCGSHATFDPGDSGDAAEAPDVIADGGATFGDSSELIDGGVGCTGDLREVLDKNGVVLATCPPDEGCAGGQCVAACVAAGAGRGSIGCDYVVATPSFFD